ncbi:hypothetical protein IJ118_03525 [Candidatus Saccharibacteria bacterium]|nr:hypothetical protein [Candidatus Saccharibacteria bacterium]
MKRRFLFLISTLIAFLPGVSSGAALATDGASEKSSWTAYELMEMDSDVRAAIAAECPTGSYSCKENFFNSRAAENPVYGALKRFYYDRLLITSFNPTERTIKVVYRDRNFWSENTTAEDLLALFIVRYDRGYLPDDTSIAAMSDTDTRTHTVYYDTPSNHATDGWFPANTEVTLPMWEMSYDPNVRDRFDYLVVTTDQNNITPTSGIAMFDNVIGSAVNFRDGSEYHIAFGADGSQSYQLAANDSTPGVADAPDVTTTPSAAESGEGEGTASTDLSVVYDLESSNAEDATLILAPDTSVAADYTVLATSSSETLTSKEDTSGALRDFPWWILGASVLFSGVVAGGLLAFSRRRNQ